MRKSIKALLATGLILASSLTGCQSSIEVKVKEKSYPIAYALKESGEYTLTDYDFLRISTDTYRNNNGRIYKLSITTTNFYIVENIGKKYYGEYYIWYYSPCTLWIIESSYSIE